MTVARLIPVEYRAYSGDRFDRPYSDDQPLQCRPRKLCSLAIDPLSNDR